MSVVFAGVCSHGPGITARSERADPESKQRLDAAFERMRMAIAASRPDALLIIAAEHFANFFMNNMPSFAVGMADQYEGPVEDAKWLGIPHRKIPGSRKLSLQLIEGMMEQVDVSYCEEWKFDHGIMVPLHHLLPAYDLPVIPINVNCQAPPMAPLHRVYALGQAIRAASDRIDARIAVVGTGGISHWPCTPDSGKINEPWDRDFMDRWCRNDRHELTAYTDEAIYRDAGQGGFEIRTFVAIAGVAEGARGEVWCYEPIPAFSCGCTVGVMQLTQ